MTLTGFRGWIVKKKRELIINNDPVRKELGEMIRNKYKAEYNLAAIEERFTTILKELTK